MGIFFFEGLGFNQVSESSSWFYILARGTEVLGTLIIFMIIIYVCFIDVIHCYVLLNIIFSFISAHMFFFQKIFLIGCSTPLHSFNQLHYSSNSDITV